MRSQLVRCGPERLATAPRPFPALDVLLVFLTGVISGALLVWGCQQRASGAARAKERASSPSPVKATSVSPSKVVAAPVFATPPLERPALTYEEQVFSPPFSRGSAPATPAQLTVVAPSSRKR